VKAESSDYQAELEEVTEHLDLKSVIIKSQGKIVDDLAKSKADPKRLQDKLDDTHKTITELRATPLDQLLAAQDVTRGIKEKLNEAQDGIRTTAEELTYSRSENSKINVKLENSKSRKKVLEVQLSELIAISKMVEDPSNNNPQGSC
jgi:chromosome segregation ATPase